MTYDARPCSTRPYRVGLIVPSSNVTMETELPALFRRREAIRSERFTVHSARMRMTRVTPEALAAMNGQGDRCAVELADAQCDVLAYACLVAVMVSGPGAHREAEIRLADAGGRPVVTSAGALVDGVHRTGASRIAMITPYAPPLTQAVVDYLAAEDVEVVDAVSLGVTDNCAVGRLDPAGLVDLIGRLDLARAEALVLSACVQMPSLSALADAERRAGLPVLTAATATTRAVLDTLGLDAQVPGGGCLLSDDLARTAG
jgi:maleate isomerase